MSRERIIETAIRIFGEKGVKTTKLQDIATAAKVSKKTIYKYFESKDDLVASVFRETAQIVNSKVEALISSPVRFPEKMAGLIEIVAQDMKFLSPVLVNEMQGFSFIEELISSYVHHAVFERFTKFVSEGKEQGFISKETRVESLTLLYKDAIMNFIFMRTLTNVPGDFLTQSPLQNFCEALATIFRGVLVDEFEKQFDARYRQISI